MDKETSFFKFDDIVNVVCNECDVSISKIFSKSRERSTVLARKIVQYIAYNYTQLSLDDVASKTGVGHHTTIIASKRTISGLIDVDKRFANKIDRILLKIKEVDLLQNKISGESKIIYMNIDMFSEFVKKNKDCTLYIVKL